MKKFLHLHLFVLQLASRNLAHECLINKVIIFVQLHDDEHNLHQCITNLTLTNPDSPNALLISHSPILQAELMVFDAALDADARAQLMYALSKKWGLTGVTDSDGDGVLDYIDESPAPLAPNVATSDATSDSGPGDS